MLHISEQDIIDNYSMEECLKDVVEGFKIPEQGKVETPHRIQLNHELRNSHSLYMPSYIRGSEFASVKVVTLFPDNAGRKIPMIQSTLLLLETRTGKHIALIEANHLTIMRTGGISGIATKYLSRKDSTILTVIGCGTQSYGQIQAVLETRPISKIILFNRTLEKANKLKERIHSSFLNWEGEVTIEKDPDLAV